MFSSLATNRQNARRAKLDAYQTWLQGIEFEEVLVDGGDSNESDDYEPVRAETDCVMPV